MPKFYRTLIAFALIVPALCLIFRVPAAGSSSPLSSYQVVPAAPRQGETLAVYVVCRSTPPAVCFNEKSYRLFPLDNSSSMKLEDASGQLSRAESLPFDSAKRQRYRALIAVPATMSEGKKQLSIGNEARTLVVQPGGFGTQKIHLSAQKDNFIASPGEEQEVDRVKSITTDRQLWTGKFVAPLKARLSSRFGLRRMVNGRLLADYFHSGLDYAAASGAEVGACQRGTVVLAHTGWRLHGNIVALDHGQGVISFYLHLSKILVKPGQLVEPGQAIGKVGATGRATGPHLHFSLYVGGVATNPLDWFERDF